MDFLAYAPHLASVQGRRFVRNVVLGGGKFKKYTLPLKKIKKNFPLKKIKNFPLKNKKSPLKKIKKTPPRRGKIKSLQKVYKKNVYTKKCLKKEKEKEAKRKRKKVSLIQIQNPLNK